MRIPGFLLFWKNWDDSEKASAIRITGFAIAAVTIFFFLSTVSYLFCWKQDMSLLANPDAMDAGTSVHNLGNKLGFRLSHLLIGELFGLGSFALLVIPVALSARLIAGRWKRPLLRTCLESLSGAFILSLIFGYAGSIAGLDSIFAGGLGGSCGALVIAWAVNLIGLVATAAVLVVLTLCWLFCTSSRFNMMMASLGKKKTSHSEVAESEAAAAQGTAISEEQTLSEDPEPESAVIPADQSAVAESTATEDGQTDATENTVVFGESATAAGEPVPQGESSPAGKEMEVITDDCLNQEVTEELPPIDNRLDMPEGLPKYKIPTIDLLQSHSSGRRDVSMEELQRNNNRIRATLKNYKIEVVDVKAVVGPTVTLYKVFPAPGVKIADIRKLQEDIALSLNARGVRVVTLNDSVGIEVANDFSSIVPLKSLLNDDAFRNSKADLPVAIGYTITQKVKVFDLADAPHLLVAGATKQGKSVGLNIIINSLLFSKHPSELKFVFIDPKMVEFSAYSGLLKHFLAVLPTAADEEEERNSAIVKTAPNAEKILRSLCIEMDERYELLSRSGVNNIKLYNEKFKNRKLSPKNGHRYLPYLVVVVDEYADLTMTVGAAAETKAASKSITNSIIRLAQKGRAAGLHVILATQRPSVDVISGIIKSNFPMRIAFRVASRVDSTTILDAPGAEKLIGKGDMLFSAGIGSERIQCGYISNDEISAITSYIAEQQGYAKSYNTPYYLPEAEDTSSSKGSVDMKDLDERFEEAARLVITTQKGSTSDIQRKLAMGYAKAGRVMDQLEAAGIVGPQEGSKPRQVLVSTFDELERILDAYRK
ncbi:MAG: DNA translocase FtsK 4TM domain-containing protein [Candidatus Cryptobacteroides sp.]|nr:DNA translocase FtsK 4TM domain-containing protein [Candidatus Cryptobacteroides sp.]